MKQDPPTAPAPVFAALEHLTGPSRGRVAWLAAVDLAVVLGADRMLRFLPAGAEPDADLGEGTIVARFSMDGTDHKIVAETGCDIWVNGKQVTEHRLTHGDMIEFCEAGPISRFRLFTDARPVKWTIDDIFGDSVAYLRSSRKPLKTRVAHAAGDLSRRLVHETTIFFRLGVVVALLALTYLVYTQYRTIEGIEARIERGNVELEGVAAALAKSRDEALRPSDLTALREELSQRVTLNVERLEVLERHSGAAARVIAAAQPSIAFLQGAYGMRHRESGQMLRHVLSADGIPIMTPWGQPLLAPTGDGPVAEINYTGTAFLVGETGHLVTNRHVAMPWESSGAPTAISDQGMEPVVLKFIGYFPGTASAAEMTVIHASDAVDLAVLQAANLPATAQGLTLAADAPRAGDEVIVMGYPTGLRTLLAQSGMAFVKELEADADTDFWSVAERLAHAGMILPLASGGIVGQVAREAIVYDAETTHGGSGGPVLNDAGEVIAINSAILPEFGGSNLGVPVEKLRAVLREIAVN